MQRFILTIITLACLALLPVTSATAFLFDDTLVSIDGNSYSTEDFKRWFSFWKDEDSSLPETPDPYIAWLLLSREAEHMELASDPGFQRQTRVFLQVRGLLRLKYDMVDSRIKVTDTDIKTRYEERYLPRWLMQPLELKDEETAMAAWQELAAGTLTVSELLGRDPEKGGPVTSKEYWIRPIGIDPEWETIFRKMAVGEVADPGEHQKGKFLYFLKEQKGGDEEDLASLSEEIQRDLWKEQEDQLTRALLIELQDKYQVEVDKERLAALDINGAVETFTDAAVITTSRKNFSEKEFILILRNVIANRPLLIHDVEDEEKVQDVKLDTAYNIINQNITDWEALDRHYEEKEPFKWEYEFNYRHRLVQALEQRLFVPETQVTDEEIKRYYEKNISRYSQPTMVKLHIIDETMGPIDQIWADVAVGKDFNQVLQQYGQKSMLQEVPANHLDPEVKAVVDKLIDGETSQIFRAQGIRVMVHLFQKTLERPLPLESVKKSISSKLSREKLNQLRSAYVNQLKSNSDIEVRMRKWKEIQKELGGA